MKIHQINSVSQLPTTLNQKLLIGPTNPITSSDRALKTTHSTTNLNKIRQSPWPQSAPPKSNIFTIFQNPIIYIRVNYQKQLIPKKLKSLNDRSVPTYTNSTRVHQNKNLHFSKILHHQMVTDQTQPKIKNKNLKGTTTFAVKLYTSWCYSISFISIAVVYRLKRKSQKNLSQIKNLRIQLVS